jgi:hypothetical protein
MHENRVPLLLVPPMRRALLLALAVSQPSGTRALKRTHNKDGCVFSCRYRAAHRTPTWVPPLAVFPCTVTREPARTELWRWHCALRPNHSSSSATSPAPHLFVALTTIPGRSRSLARAIASLRSQQRPADRILLSAARTFERARTAGSSGGGVAPELIPSGASDALEVLHCARDDGPGTKLLCALPRLRELAAGLSAAAARSAFVALVDDDLVYRSWVLRLLERAVSDDARAERSAYSYDVYTLTGDGRAVTAAQYPGLLVGSGHSLLALRLSLLDGIEDFFACLQRLEPLAAWHDDVWLSMFVQDVKGQLMYRIGGTPFESAAREFPESHERTISIRQPHALARPQGRNHSVAAHSAGPRNASAPSRPETIDRDELNRAMARLRLRVLSAGLCGVRPNSSLCSSAWCVIKSHKEWGAHTSIMPWEERASSRARGGKKRA